jgi:hypothetical protein
MNQVRKMFATASLRLRRLKKIHSPLRRLRHSFLKGCIDGFLELLRWTFPEKSSFGPPNRTVSVYQALRTGLPKTTGRIVLEDQGCPKVTEDCLMVTGGYHQHEQQPWPIFWSRHSNVHLVTSSLALMFEHKRICLESVYGYLALRDDPGFRFLTLPKPVELKGDWTSVVSRWIPAGKNLGYPNYTHWLLDALPRLALLPEFPSSTRIIVPARLHKNQAEALRLMGIFDRCRPTPEQHLQVENYYFSSPTTMLQSYNPYGIDFLRRTFLPKRDTSYHGPKKFFIQRLGLMREPINRVEIEKFFEEHGWQPIDIMQLSFAQQIQLFAEADSITGMFGSGFTNGVFCRKGCKIFNIMPFDYGVDGFLEWIGQVVGYELRQMVIPGSYDYRFSVDLQAVKVELAASGML